MLTIGDELLRGEIIDSNKSFLSQRLLTLDIETRWHVTCADDRADMTELFRRAAARSDVVLVSGGLGPTRDDLTMEVLAATFGRKLVLHQPSLDALRGFFARFGREMAAINEKQAWFPEGAESARQPDRHRARHDARGSPEGGGSALFFCMPGVPRELYKMMDEQVLPRIASRLRRSTSWVRASLLRTFGVGESNLDEMLREAAAARRRRARLPHAVPGQPRATRRARGERGRGAGEARAVVSRCCASGSARSSTAKARTRSKLVTGRLLDRAAARRSPSRSRARAA